MTEPKERVDLDEKTIGVNMQRENVAVVHYSDESSKAPVDRTGRRAITCGVAFREPLPAAQMTDQPDNETPDKRETDEERADDEEQEK